MKALILIILMSISFTSMNGQALIFPESEWHYNTVYPWVGNGFAELKYEQDTILGDSVAHVLSVTTTVYDNISEITTISSWPPEFIHVNENQVYRYINENWHLLYDLNAEVGDTLDTYSVSSCGPDLDQIGMSKIDSVGVKEINGESLRYLYLTSLSDFSEAEYSGYIYERIGSLQGFPQDGSICDDMFYNTLKCYNDSEFSYQNPNFNEDCDFLLGIDEYEENPLSVYPNPSSGRFVIELPVLRLRSGTFDLSVFDALGVEVFNQDDVMGEQIEFDLSGYAVGVYLVQLSVGKKSAGSRGSGASSSTGAGTYGRVYYSKIVKR